MLATKQVGSFRKGRVDVRKEARMQLAIRNNLERRFNKRLNAMFKRFVNVHMFLYKRYGIYEPDIASGSLNEDLIPAVLMHYKRITRLMYETNERLANRKSAIVFGREIDFERRVEEYFRGRQLVLVGISQSMANKIQNEIVLLRSEGLSASQIASAITAKFNRINLARARTIARTETHNAASFASHQYHVDVQNTLGTKMKKKWVATRDERTRPFHAEMNGKPAIDMDEDFEVGGVKMKYAGDPKGGAKNVINCRCVVIYVDEEDLIT